MTRCDARKTNSDTLPYLSIFDLNHARSLIDGIETKLISTYYFKEQVTFADINLSEPAHIKLSFVVEEDIWHTQTIFLENSVCQFGGIRWWLRCPKCWQKVGKLYLRGKYYWCRVCHDLTYASRLTNSNSAYFGFGVALEASIKASELLKNMKRRQYAGKPTKRVQQILRLNNTIEFYYKPRPP